MTIDQAVRKIAQEFGAGNVPLEKIIEILVSAVGQKNIKSEELEKILIVGRSLRRLGMH